MAGLAWAHIRRRPGRALALGSGVLIAAICFGLLSAETRSSRAQVSATVRHNFRAAYDILVRPRAAQTAFERSHRVVDDGFLSALFGGITMRQYREIRSLPGVALAAPVANAGYFVYQQTLLVPFPRDISRTRPELFRAAVQWSVHHGLSRYPGATLYVYWSPGTLQFTPSHDKYQPAPIGRETMPGGRSLAVCEGFSQSTPPLASHGSSAAASGVAGVSINPYAAADQPSFDCAARLVSLDGRAVRDNEPGALDAEPSGQLGAEVTFEIPVLVAGIDPRTENALVGLHGAMRSGDYLRDGEGLSAPGDVPATNQGSSQCADYTRGQRLCAVRTYPVIASTRTYIDEAAHVTVEQLRAPAGISLASQMSNDRTAYTFITHLAGRTVARLSVSPTHAWQAGLAHFSANQGFNSADGSGFSLDYWRPSATHDRLASGGVIAPATVANDPNVWSDSGQVQGLSLAPPGSADTWYRHLTAYPSSGAPRTIDGAWTGITPLPRLVGTFDPTRLRGFSPLSRVPLQSFYPPTVTGADTKSRRALGDRALGPTSNIAGYLSQPPLLLTTLAGAIALENGKGDTTRVRGHPVDAYQGASPHAPISSIQVRVRGVSGPNPRSLTRIDAVASAIDRRTGLTVDVTAGSSPTSERIALANGRFGQPQLRVEQGWIKKGVAVSITAALRGHDLGLVGLTVLICSLSVAATTVAAVRGRREELGTLHALGWSQRDLFALVLGEIALVGALAGAVGAALTIALVHAGGLAIPAVRIAVTVPLGVAVAVLAGVVPARLGAHVTPLDALRAPVRPVHRAAWPPRSVRTLALANLRQVPGRSLLALSTMALGTAGLVFLIAVDLAFQHRVGGDLLGGAISRSVSTVQLVSAALVTVLGAGTLGGVVYTDQRERAPELATLRSLGWTSRTVSALTSTECALLGSAGLLPGVALGTAAALATGVQAAALVTGAAIGLTAGAGLTVLASGAVAASRSDHVQLSQ